MSKMLIPGGLCLALLLGFVLSGCGPGVDQAQASPQAYCPMMPGKAIDKKISVDHNGKRIYFCCAGCIKAFNADPEKNIKKMTDGGVILDNATEDHSEHEHEQGHHEDGHEH